MSQKKKSKRKNIKKAFTQYAIPIAVGVLLAMLLRHYVILNIVVPTESMESTILPGDNILGSRLAYKKEEPKRGDIVIFRNPDDPSQTYIKRVIGLPGDTVELRYGNIYINGNLLYEPYLKEAWTKKNNGLTYQVPADDYFMLGDNRNNSEDSRYWKNTYVNKKDIFGKAVFRYFPNRFGWVQ